MKRVIRPMLVPFFLVVLSPPLWAAQPHEISPEDYLECKKLFDDPTPFYECNNYYAKWVPQEDLDMLTFDQEEMKKTWEEALGFKAPDVVGKIAPEIKPGKYTYKDKEKYPFKELMLPYFYDKFNPPGEGGPNHIGNFTEIEVVPTRQYYYPLPLAKATIANMGKAKLDEDGYLDHKTVASGVLFPRPSGKNKGWQIVYNMSYFRFGFESSIDGGISRGINTNWAIDYGSVCDARVLKLHTRCVMPPFGWFDKRAERMEEMWLGVLIDLWPREIYGNQYMQIFYTNPEKQKTILAYVNFLRRVRKISGSDSQDRLGGADMAYDDNNGFNQILSRDVYPYEISVIEEREFLALAPTRSGKQWISQGEKFLYKELQFERRPMYVVEMKQLDKNYIYSKRVGYVDKELLVGLSWLFYDQKGRLYRTWTDQFVFIPHMGTLATFQRVMLDFIDVHSTWDFFPSIPSPHLRRSDFSLRKLMTTK